MQLTSTVSGAAAFEADECLAYYNTLTSLPDNAVVVEIGLQFGRSSSIAAQVGKAKQFEYIGIDPFTDPPEAAEAWTRMMQGIGMPYALLKMRSDRAYGHIDGIDCILIDGAHDFESVLEDCAYLDRTPVGAYALFHDYGRDSLPGVYRAVNTWMVERPWWKQQSITGTLGIWRSR